MNSTMPKINKLKDHEAPQRGVKKGTIRGPYDKDTPPTISTTLRFDADVYKALKIKALSKGISVQKHINEILAEHVKVTAK